MVVKLWSSSLTGIFGTIALMVKSTILRLIIILLLIHVVVLARSLWIGVRQNDAITSVRCNVIQVLVHLVLQWLHQSFVLVVRRPSLADVANKKSH